MGQSKKFDLRNYSENGSKRYLLEVGPDYPNKLHDLHNDHTLVSKKVKVTKEMLHEYQLQIIEHNEFSHGKNEKTNS